MSLKQSIRRILREESSLVEKINLMIKKFGLLKTIRAVGSHIKFKNIYGDNLTKEEKIVLLRDIVNRYSSDNEGYYIDVANYDIFVDIDYNQTDSYDYITKITFINSNGSFNFRQYPYGDVIDVYDWDDYYNGTTRLNDLSESELDNIIDIICEKKNIK